MTDVQRLRGGKVESPPPVGNDDAVSPSPSSRGDGRDEQATPPHAPNNFAWVVLFKLSVTITVISVRSTPSHGYII